MFDIGGLLPYDGPLSLKCVSIVLFVHEDLAFTGNNSEKGLSFLGGAAREDELPRACAQREIAWSILFPTTEEAVLCTSLVEHLDYSDFLLMAGGRPHLVSLFSIDWPSGYISLLPAARRGIEEPKWRPIIAIIQEIAEREGGADFAHAVHEMWCRIVQARSAKAILQNSMVLGPSQLRLRRVSLAMFLFKHRVFSVGFRGIGIGYSPK